MVFGERYRRSPQWFESTSYAAAALTVVLVAVGIAYGADHYDVLIEHDVPANIRDGIMLRSDILSPERSGKFPVILHGDTTTSAPL